MIRIPFLRKTTFVPHDWKSRMTLGKRSRCQRRSSPWCWYYIGRIVSWRATLPSIADHPSKFRWVMSYRSYTPQTYNDLLSRFCSSYETECPHVRKKTSSQPCHQFYQTSLSNLFREVPIWNLGNQHSCKIFSCNFVFLVFIFPFLIIWTYHALPSLKLIDWRATSKTTVKTPLFWFRSCQVRSMLRH